MYFVFKTVLSTYVQVVIMMSTSVLKGVHEEDTRPRSVVSSSPSHKSPFTHPNADHPANALHLLFCQLCLFEFFITFFSLTFK